MFKAIAIFLYIGKVETNAWSLIPEQLSLQVNSSGDIGLRRINQFHEQLPL